jgi:bacterioferritin-associated ferredoxin
MVVCICKCVSDKMIKKLMDSGVKDVETIEARTGAGTQCGMCILRIEEMLEERKIEE